MAAREWQVEVLRFTFIGLADEAVERFKSMKELTGMEPETVTNRPQLRSTTEEVDWEEGRLSVVSQPSRIDLIYSAPMQEAVMAMPDGGSFKMAGERLIPFLSAIADEKVGRVAFGGVVLHLVPDVAAGYEGLRELLPFVSFEADMKEFQLQINRPKEFQGLPINEMGKWSVATMKFMHLDHNQGVAYDVAGQSAVRFEFDFNSTEQFSVPEEIKVLDLLSHLLARSIAVSQEGAV
ncbi:hypothetical protein UB43_03630 [Pseudomonas sp. 21]|uniref:hypothetical protein n=1 Tax=Pseudomonas sp. 21 TaxID=1619948 RepID=UPI0005EBAA8B|nr:hypothetical protein [Pseudomonas sp. 21]KJK03597.1 hypothetical protein UB43_03630 [Pseudomonas sp. 21]